MGGYYNQPSSHALCVYCINCVSHGITLVPSVFVPLNQWSGTNARFVKLAYAVRNEDLRCEIATVFSTTLLHERVL